MIKKYIRLLSWKLHEYTERWLGLDEIVKMIVRGEYHRAQIHLDKLRDDYGNDPRFDEVQFELDCMMYPPPLNLKEEKDLIVSDLRELR